MVDVDDKFSCGHGSRHSLCGIFVASTYVTAPMTARAHDHEWLAPAFALASRAGSRYDISKITIGRKAA